MVVGGVSCFSPCKTKAKEGRLLTSNANSKIARKCEAQPRLHSVERFSEILRFMCSQQFEFEFFE